MKPCQKPSKYCEFKTKAESGAFYCNIQGNHYKCVDEEVYVADQSEMRENLKTRGVKEIDKITQMVKQLVDYADYCADPNALDRISDATKELRKARLHLKAYYGIED